MSDQSLKLNDDYLKCAKELVDSLEHDDMATAKTRLDTLTRLNETEMFREIGKITRDLHNALASFEIDSHISRLAEEEIPVARERLNYVIEMTENAANITLNVIEGLIPECNRAEIELHELTEQWRQFLKKDMNGDEFRHMVRHINNYFESADKNLKTLKSGLNEVLMAQSYQDLSGQIIKHVITLVQDVETNLVDVIRLTGGKRVTDSDKMNNNIKVKQLDGPQVPGLTSHEAVSGQDEVDDLLSSLGF